MAKKTIMSGVSGVTNNETLKTEVTDTVKTETSNTTEVQESEKVKLTDELKHDNSDSEDSKDAEEFNKSDVVDMSDSEDTNDSDKSDSTETQTTLEKIKEFLKRNSYNHLICGRYIQDELTLENFKKFYSEFLVYISSAEDYEFKELLEEYFAEQ